MKALNILFLIVIFSLFSCKKDTVSVVPDPVTPAETGSLTINFENGFDGTPLVFGTKYINANGDTFTVSKFNYYISNIVIVKSDNTVFSESYSYHLVKHSVSGSNNITLSGVPLGDYKSIKFMLGVDSTHNVSGTQAGDLDPVKSSDMYWSWNSGYIFMKLEGSAPTSGDLSKSITYHIGGYAGANKTQRNFTLDFGSAVASVSKTGTPKVNCSVNVAEIFKNPTKIVFATTFSQTGPGLGAKTIADNYADMITLKNIQNP